MQNNPSAFYNLGTLYEKGLGVNQDYKIALGYYNKSIDYGNPNAKEKVKLLKELINDKEKGITKKYYLNSII